MRRFLLLVVLASCSTPFKDAVAPFQDRALATIPDGTTLIKAVFNPRGTAVAYIAQTEDGFRAVREPWRSRRLDAI